MSLTGNAVSYAVVLYCGVRCAVRSTIRYGTAQVPIVLWVLYALLYYTCTYSDLGGTGPYYTLTVVRINIVPALGYMIIP
jgi:hypothetical protein